jgi:hypothetical protein
MFQDGVFTEDGHLIMCGFPHQVAYWLLTNRQTGVVVELGVTRKRITPAEYLYGVYGVY